MSGDARLHLRKLYWEDTGHFFHPSSSTVEIHSWIMAYGNVDHRLPLLRQNKYYSCVVFYSSLLIIQTPPIVWRSQICSPKLKSECRQRSEVRSQIWSLLERGNAWRDPSKAHETNTSWVKRTRPGHISHSSQRKQLEIIFCFTLYFYIYMLHYFYNYKAHFLPYIYFFYYSNL